MARAVAWGAAALIGSALASAVLVTGFVDILSATGQWRAARSLGWGDATVARELFGRDPMPDSVGAEEAAVARASLHVTPLVPGALRILADERLTVGDTPRATALLTAAAGLGWRDAVTQRRLYRVALAQRRHADALDHADALLRLNARREPLFADLAAHMGDPTFRRALARRSAASVSWGDQFLHTGWRRLQPEVLQAYVADRTATGRPVARAELAPVLGAMARAGRLPEAQQLWDQRFGAPITRGARRLRWPDQAALDHPTPFDWTIPLGYAVLPASNGAPMLSFTDTGSDEGWPMRTMVLAPGRYELLAPRDADVAAWRWSMACDTDAPRPARPLTDTDLDVPHGCAFVRLAVAARSGEGSEARLGELQLVPAAR